MKTVRFGKVLAFYQNRLKYLKFKCKMTHHQRDLNLK